METRLAPVWKRAIAYAVDGMLAFLPVFVVAALPLPEAVWTPLVLAAGVVGVAYHFFCDALPHGQSYGKRIFGIAVRDRSTRRYCAASQSFIRNLLLVLLGPIDWIFILGPSHRRLGDRFANTIVVEASWVHPSGDRREGVRR